MQDSAVVLAMRERLSAGSGVVGAVSGVEVAQPVI